MVYKEEEWPLLPLLGNGNSNGTGGFVTKSKKKRRTGILIGCIGLFGVAATLVMFRRLPVPLRLMGIGPNENDILTAESVRKLARDMGSTAMENARTEDICDSNDCLEASARLLNSIDFSVDPCQDFYEFACGRWVANNQIPPSKARWGQFDILEKQINQINQEILTTATDPKDPKPVNQAKEFYKDCIDTDALEANGVKPVRDLLQKPGHGDWPILIGSHWKQESFDWLITISDQRREVIDMGIISVSVDQDSADSNKYVIYVDQPSLILPRAVLVNDGRTYDNILKAYKEFIVTAVGILAAGGGDVPAGDVVEEEAQQIIMFESEIAKITTKDELRSDTSRMYNPFTLDEYQVKTDSYGNLAPHLGIGLNWFTLITNVFKTSGVSPPPDVRVIVQELEYFEKLIPLLLATDPRVLANYVQLRTVIGFSGAATKDLRDAAFKFNQAQTGAKEPPKRSEACADEASSGSGDSTGLYGFGMAIGVKYIAATNFDDKAKTDVNRMVKDLRVSFKSLLASATWMDPKTKFTAQDKLDKMTSFMGYPDWLENKTKLEEYYANLEIVPSNHIQSVLQLAEWAGNKVLVNLEKPVDRTQWTTYPEVVNAFYAPNYNSITFPAGILQTPFFKRGAPASLNYGAIGAVIGHEITHGFDNSGRQYDAKGDAVPWWTNDTLAKFNKKADCIRDEYDTYKPTTVDLHVNGALTLGENIADNGGVREAFLAYKKYEKENGVERRLPGLEQYDPEQLFFLGFATIWCERITEEETREFLLTDVHSPSRFRVQGALSNNADFGLRWNCPVGSSMNPGPKHSCRLW